MYKTKSFLYLIMALLLISTSVLTACQAAPTVKDKELNMLCTPQEEWCNGMKQEFEKKYGITVNFVRMSSGEALARLQAEKANPQFDVWWGGPVDSFIAAQVDGILEPYASPNFANLLNQELYKAKDNTWSAIYMGSLGFGTNKDWLAKNPNAKAPTSWDDLLKPEFKGQVMMAHPSSSGTAYTAIATVLQIRGEQAGWEYVKKLTGQMSQYTKSGAAPAKFVGQGEAAVSIVFSHDIVNEIDNNKLPLVLTFPAEGTGYEIAGQAVVKGAKHMEAAKLWIDWALTPETQNLGPKYKAYQAPTVKGAIASKPELLQVKLITYNFDWAGKNKKTFVDKFTNELAKAENLK